MARSFLISGPVPALLLALAVAAPPGFVCAQEKPYFVTYSHDLEEPGNLEIETKTALGQPPGSHRYGATASELEYGVRAWWTSELYLDGQATAQDSTIFTGFRLENRFRPLMREHVVNPVLYVEYENISGADKTILEFVGHDGQADLADPNAISRQEHQHEAELKLILSSNLKAWNISENFISEKNLGHEPWEFGYALGAARPLRTLGSGKPCTFCFEKFMAGAEAYGGLGNTDSLTLHDTSHYIAPTVGWQLPFGRLSFSTGFGLTSSSLDRIYRIGWASELPQVGSWFRSNKGGAR
ncbi:hypothetical protein P8935_10930 [Telmatobacter sp. DSM 110680]|uniref:Uncharacterized protein n=1 Tax=Telmatobacter sp. DSM 110680 TaxID=3036704 RepID=A0AAU7DNU1_9BACT